jgi:hypothetical protein
MENEFIAIRRRLKEVGATQNEAMFVLTQMFNLGSLHNLVKGKNEKFSFRLDREASDNPHNPEKGAKTLDGTAETSLSAAAFRMTF